MQVLIYNLYMNLLKFKQNAIISNYYIDIGNFIKRNVYQYLKAINSFLGGSINSSFFITIYSKKLNIGEKYIVSKSYSLYKYFHDLIKKGLLEQNISINKK